MIRRTRKVYKNFSSRSPGLISSIISPPLLTTSTTENPNLPTPTPLPPDFLPSVLFRSEAAAALYGGVLFISRTFSQRCATHAPGDATCMQSLLDTFFQASVSGKEK
ncbi:hypothetical protein EDB83DRAFT_447129 [Lactarius deliciosus]|nr:hypothetical protein EDB83DRAFT_447129 [Lactarius deliciosus]